MNEEKHEPIADEKDNGLAITVWWRDDCPKDIWDAIENKSDIDYVAYVPDKFVEKSFLPVWMDEGSSFGCSSVEEYKWKDGKIIVGHHS